MSSGWGFESAVERGWGLSGHGFALECVRCLLDIQYNLASGNKGLQLKKEMFQGCWFSCRDGLLGQGNNSASSEEWDEIGKRVVQEKPRQERV